MQLVLLFSTKPVVKDTFLEVSSTFKVSMASVEGAKIPNLGR